MLNLIAIYCIPIISNSMFLTSPIIDSMVKYFGEDRYSTILMVHTLPAIVALPFVIISGNVVGKAISYRKTMNTVIPLIIITGLMPYFLRDLNLILFFRAAYGMFVGMIAPQGNALILKNYRGKERNRYLGYYLAVIGLAGVIYQMSSGWLCIKGWEYAFLGHLIPVVPFIFVLIGLREPEHIEEEIDLGSQKDDRKSSHKGAFLVFLIIFILYLGGQSPSLVMSSLVAERGLGDSVTSASILSSGTAGTIVAGFLYPVFCKHVKKNRSSILVAGLALAAFMQMFDSVNILMLSCALNALFFMMNLNLMTVRASECFSREDSGKAVSVIQCGDKCGSFFCTYYTAFLVKIGTMAAFPLSIYRFPLLGYMIICIALAILEFFLENRKNSAFA